MFFFFPLKCKWQSWVSRLNVNEKTERGTPTELSTGWKSRLLRRVVLTMTQIVGILGPRGSGVYWLRHMVEQMTGIYTGSPYNEYPHIFKAEGDTKEVRTPALFGTSAPASAHYCRLTRLTDCEVTFFLWPRNSCSLITKVKLLVQFFFLPVLFW